MDEVNDEISVIYKIFQEIYLKAPPILKDLSSESIDVDYKKCIDDQIDFKTIDDNFQCKKYCSITDVIKDIRLVLLNCYKYYGTHSDHTIKSLELEELLEEKISYLNDYYKALADIKLTFKFLDLDGKPNSKVEYPKDCYDSMLLKSVAHCHPGRIKKENNKILCSTTDEDNTRVLEEIIGWEKEIYFIEHYQYISSMWELPEIGNFMAIIFKKLNIDIVNQGEIERMFLIPKESKTMGKVMSFLLMPIRKKAKFSDQIMPYKVWSGKLDNKLSEWYKVYHANQQNKVNVMNLLGIHPDFWAIVGDKNPLIENDYCELSYFVKVWLVKGLCDYVTNRYTTINDIILNCNERQCTIWKNDLETEEYFYFKSMPDLRIYYYYNPYDEPSLEFLETEKIKKDINNRDVLSNSGVTNIFCLNSRVQPNRQYFKVIANSVQGLRAFLDELDTEDISVPVTLISALKKFITEIEPEECNLIVLNNNSKIKLFKEWKSYSERYQNGETLNWEEKNSKPKSPVVKEEIILEKRKRSVGVYNNANFIFDSDGSKIESDEYISETDESFCDYSDSEDEWGAINKIKSTITKQVTKIDELERKFKEKKRLVNTNNKDKLTEFQKIKRSVNNMDNKNNINNVSSVDDGLLIKSQKEENKLISSCNKQTHIVESDEVILLIDNEKEDNNQILTSNKLKHKIDTSMKTEEPGTKKNKPNSVKEAEIIILNDDDIHSSEEDSCKKSNSAESNQNNEVISIEDNEQILISDDDDDVQFIGCTIKQAQPSKINKSSSLRNNLTRPQNYINRKNQITNTNNVKCQVQPTKTNILTHSPNISVMPANIHLPKPIQVTTVKQPQTTMPAYFNATKRSVGYKGHQINNSNTVNVKCKVITKSNYDGEVKFYIDLPNGNHHPVSDELMNQYLKEHNNRLPDYWLVPLTVEVAKEYGFI